ncbi:hypothetical protein [Aestuariibacter salexigens]|uniref:hypothetical protein n=1 Tax=Aestuariibacter salexigens TaxID=226010 RepID=UPI0004208556|nr:hypothetical protein [Aestuariibacter salexigens]
MNKIVQILLVLFVVTAITSGLSHLQSADIDPNERSQDDQQRTALAPNDWVAALEALPQYKKPAPPPRKPQNTAQQNAKPKPQPKPPRQPTIDDSVLIGIVYDQPRQAILVNKKKGSQPFYLSEGEGWLTDWRLAQIQIDRLVWVNDMSGDKHIQLMFGKS